jgi:hypothetical protein
MKQEMVCELSNTNKKNLLKMKKIIKEKKLKNWMIKI